MRVKEIIVSFLVLVFATVVGTTFLHSPQQSSQKTAQSVIQSTKG